MVRGAIWRPLSVRKRRSTNRSMHDGMSSHRVVYFLGKKKGGTMMAESSLSKMSRGRAMMVSYRLTSRDGEGWRSHDGIRSVSKKRKWEVSAWRMHRFRRKLRGKVSYSVWFTGGENMMNMTLELKLYSLMDCAIAGMSSSWTIIAPQYRPFHTSVVFLIKAKRSGLG